MSRLLILLAATALAPPALAQHAGHGAPSQQAPAADCAPEHAAMGHCTPVKVRPVTDPHAGHAAPAADPHAGHAKPAQTTPPAPTGDPNCAPEHAAMGHCTPVAAPAPAAPVSAPHAHDAIPEQNAAPAADDPNCPAEHAAMGHCTPTTAPASLADPHARHSAAAAEPTAPPTAPPPPAATAGPAHAADFVYGEDAMAEAREMLRREHGAISTYKFLVDQAEGKVRDGRDGYAWDAQAWYGGDINKAWLKSEGEGAFGESLERAEVQALWSRAIDPWFDLQAGIRQDFGHGPDRTHLALGVQGLAPYWFEVDGALFLSTKGDVTARFEAEYDLRITQRLILQPLVEFDLSAQDIPELGIGSGLSSAGIAARLRYEIRPEFAPYVGLEYERAFGDTADLARAAGEDVSALSFVLGIRTWF